MSFTYSSKNPSSNLNLFATLSEIPYRKEGLSRARQRKNYSPYMTRSPTSSIKPKRPSLVSLASSHLAAKPTSISLEQKILQFPTHHLMTKAILSSHSRRSKSWKQHSHLLVLWLEQSHPNTRQKLCSYLETPRVSRSFAPFSYTTIRRQFPPTQINIHLFFNFFLKESKTIGQFNSNTPPASGQRRKMNLSQQLCFYIMDGRRAINNTKWVVIVSTRCAAHQMVSI